MNIKKLLLTSFFCLLLSACSFGQGQKENTASEFQSKTLFAMDTSMQIKIYSSKINVMNIIERRINELDATFDRGNVDSDIYLINSSSTPVTVSNDTVTVINYAIDIGNKTDGQPWSVAIQDPFNSDKYIGAVYVSDKAIVTSGSYQRYFTSNGNIYHHIINPNTGYPVNNNLASVSVISDSGMKADALSTSLFVMGMEKAIEYQKKYKDFEVVFITNENEIYITSGLQNNFKSDRSFSIIE